MFSTAVLLRTKSVYKLYHICRSVLEKLRNYNILEKLPNYPRKIVPFSLHCGTFYLLVPDPKHYKVEPEGSTRPETLSLYNSWLSLCPSLRVFTLRAAEHPARTKLQMKQSLREKHNYFAMKKEIIILNVIIRTHTV